LKFASLKLRMIVKLGPGCLGNRNHLYLHINVYISDTIQNKVFWNVISVSQSKLQQTLQNYFDNNYEYLNINHESKTKHHICNLVT